jgi:hypothetical protein
MKWTSEEDAQLENEIDQKLNFDEIARRHNRTIGAIRARIATLDRILTQRCEVAVRNLRNAITNSHLLNN